MNKFCLLSTVLLSAATAGAAEDFNGSRPMDCKPLQGHDCLPTESACKSLKPEPGGTMEQGAMHIDVNKMTVKTPYRNDTLPIQSFSFNTKSLVLQGKDLELAWTATIHRTTGRLTLVIADREGAYTIFGQCAVVGAKQPAKPKSN
jgi:hypothetical protein